jgi:hypothetical protein
MRFVKFTGGAAGVGLALTIAAATAGAQTDTTRQDTTAIRDSAAVRSTQRIPVQKERDFSRSNVRSDRFTRESTGEVMINQDSIRIDSLTAAAALDRARLDSVEARANALDRSITSFNDTIRTVRGEITTVRGELNTMTTRTAALSDSIQQLNQRWDRFRNGSLFNNSGFYVGIGSGANFTTGAMKDLGYHEGLHIAVPIGFHRPGTMLGFRGELGIQTFDGRGPTSLGGSSFSNPDPEVLSAVGMVTLHFPFGTTRRSNFYLMGGGGAYNFRDIGGSSTLSDRLNDNSTGDNVTKLGVTGGAGLEFHVLGPASLYLQSRFTNVFTDDGRLTSATDGSLRWVPLVAGITLR